MILPKVIRCTNGLSGADGYEMTRDFLAGKSFQLEAQRTSDLNQFKSDVSCIKQCSLHYSDTSYGIEARLSARAGETGYILSIPEKGSLIDVSSGEARTLPALIHSPSHDMHLLLSGVTRRKSVNIERDAVVSCLARLIEQPVMGEVIFDAEVDMTGPIGHLLHSAFEVLLNPSPCLHDGQAAIFQENLLAALLLYQPHSHSGLLGTRATSGSSGDVKRALDYIHANLQGQISLSGLVAIAGVPPRTLNDHFRQFTGLSPMGYVRRERLRLARERLSDPDAESVIQVALSCGFTHMGRFASDYRKSFGEYPTLTLGRARMKRAI